MPARRVVLPLSLAAVVAGLVPVQAGFATEPIRVREAYFRVTVEGVQRTKWTANHTSERRCDPAYTGSGSERVRFASKRAVVVRAFQFGRRGPVSLLAGPGLAELPTRGSVRRSGTLNLPPADPGCAVGDGGDGTYVPPPPDCGTKAIPALKLRLAYDALSANRITLSPAEFPSRPTFKQCPIQGVGWTTILSRDDRERTAGQLLPRDELFDRRQGKMLVLGEGKVHTNISGVDSTTRMDWTLTLTRVRKP